jgi:Ca-activated chloride channel family protein
LEKAAMSFGAPEWFWALLAIPVLAVLFIRAEKRAAGRLRQFVSPRLLPQLSATVDRPRRVFRFGLQLLGLTAAVLALTQPRWGYQFQDVQRKGLDLFIAVDTSRSMLSNDVQPNRLERVKLATQDLINQTQGDRVGLIAFAGRAFVQAPLTIDYDAVVESINDLDTKTIPEGGTNISEAINLAARTFGKTAMGNRALIIFTDGEELSGDAVKTAKTAADNGIRIFTIGVGTPQGSLIPVPDENGGSAFVKDPSGQVVKSKLDENRLREVAQATGGLYFHLESGPSTMRQLYSEGLQKMKAAEMDVRLSRRPIERYHWPLGLTLVVLTLSILIGERKRKRDRAKLPALARIATPVAVSSLLVFANSGQSAVEGLDLYHAGKFPDAYHSFEQDLKSHPDSGVRDKMQFDAGTAAYRMHEFDKALEAFSGSLLSRDKGLQETSHYNIGRTLEERADADKSDDETLKDLEDAESHYEQALKLKPDDTAAKENLEAVKKKIERLKKKPTPTPPPKSEQQKKQDKKDSDEKDKQNQQSQQNQNQKQQNQQQQDQQQQQSQAQNEKQQNQQQQQSSGSSQQQNQQQQSQSLAKNEPQKNQQQQRQPGESPSPSPSEGKGENQQQDRPSEGNRPNESPSASPGDQENASPSPGEGETPEPSASRSPSGKHGGDLKAAPGEKSEKPPDKTAQIAEADQERDGQMSEQQAKALLESMKDEEARVQLDERKVRRHVYKDW